MVSYEPKKNGRQEGSYRGATAVFESYAAYRAPPTTKPRRARTSDEESVKPLGNGCQSQYPLERSSAVPNPVTSGQRNGLSRVNSLDQSPRLPYVQGPKSQPDTAYRQTVPIYQTEFLYQDPHSYQQPQQSSYVHRKIPTTKRQMTPNSTTSIHFYSDSEDFREGSKSKNYRNHRSSIDPSTLSSGSERSSTPSSPSKVVKQQFSVVNPALLSRVSESFRARITLSNRMKENLEYKDCFDGREAVDKIAFIIKTTDRNLALLLGRALDAQKFFHDVTYDHRLRDSQNELYQFRKMPSILSSSDNYSFKKNEKEDSEETDLPTGVFTLLTDCYSPTCTRDNLCYSIVCPRRLEQHARKHMKPNPDLSRSASRGSIADRRKDQKLWIHTVPPEIANSVSEAEKKRQEAINELIYTEKDFVHDIVYLRDCWMKPLLSQNIIPEFRRKKFVVDVFHNIMEIYSINSKLDEALQKRQNSYAIVGQIGDILLEHVPKFNPFIEYGAHQLWGKYYFENEKNTNPAFAKFVEDTERLPESRKLELNGYLTKPTTRLGRYPLLLEAILKQTPQGHSDRTSLPKVISLIKECLSNVNTESGKSENRFNLQQLNDQLISNGSENFDLKLTEEGRQLIFKGSLKRSNESSDLQVFLFDHALLMVKVKIVNKVEQYKIYRRPIPIELLKVSTEESHSESSQKRTQSILPGKSPTTNRGSINHRYPLTFSCLGKKGFTENLYALTLVSRKRWIDLISEQKEVIDKNKSFEKTILIEKGQFSGANKINCAAFYDNYRNLIFGTDSGVYVIEIGQRQNPALVLQVEKVSQIEILEEHQLLLVLADKVLYSCPIDAFGSNGINMASKRLKKIITNASFFKSGICLGKALVTIVRNSPLHSTIKTLELFEQTVKSKNKESTFKGFLRGTCETLKTYKEIYIPIELASVNFLKKTLCVGCYSKGFEILDMESLNTHGLLHPNDTSHDFVRKKENTKPIAVYRVINEDFLLCYNEFAFFITKEGWRSRPDFLITWEGTPTSFAYRYPYIFAFEPSFIEIRHIETGLLEQVIEGNNVRNLFSDSRGILVSTNDIDTDSSVIFSLNIVEGKRISQTLEDTNNDEILL